MRPKEVKELLRSIIHYPEAPAIFLWGPPGVGKSSVSRQVTEEEKVGFIDLRLALMDPTDLRGIPVPENGKAKWLPPSALPTQGQGILFLDELNLAPPIVQSSAYQLVLDKRIGEYQLPDGWRIITAGNKAEHGAHVYKMAAPLRNRFVHIDFEINVDDWTDWAIKERLVSEVVEFIRFRPDLLFQFDSKRHENAFPTPRSWEFVSKLMKNNNGVSKEIINEAIKGTVGDGITVEFQQFLKMKNELPSVDEIFKGKDFVPDKTDLCCAFVTALVIKAESNQFERLLKYSAKLKPEVTVLLGKLLAMKNKETLLKCSSWSDWSKKHYELIFD